MDGPAEVFIWKVSAISLFTHSEKESIESPIFKRNNNDTDKDNPLRGCLDDTEWRLLFFPKGDESADFISLFVERVEDSCGPLKFHAQYRLCLVDSDGLEHFDVCSKHTFKKGSAHGIRRMVTRKALLADRVSFFPEDTLTFKCQLRKAADDKLQACLSIARTIINSESASFYWPIEKFNWVSEKRKAITSFSCKIQRGLLDIHCYPTKVEDSSKSQLQIVFQRTGQPPIAAADSSEAVEGDQEAQPKEATKQIFVKAKISIVDVKGKIHISKDGESLIAKPGDLWLFPALMLTNKLVEQKGNLLPGDVLTLKFELQVADGTVQTTAEAILAPEVAPKLEDGNTLLQDLRSQEESMLFTDIKLEVDGEIFHAHKSLLAARSSVFFEKLQQLNKDKVKVTTSRPIANSSKAELHKEPLTISNGSNKEEKMELEENNTASKTVEELEESGENSETNNGEKIELEEKNSASKTIEELKEAGEEGKANNGEKMELKENNSTSKTVEQLKESDEDGKTNNGEKMELEENNFESKTVEELKESVEDGKTSNGEKMEFEENNSAIENIKKLKESGREDKINIGEKMELDENNSPSETTKELKESGEDGKTIIAEAAAKNKAIESEDVLLIEDVDKDTMKSMLKFLYTDTVNPFDFDSGFKLYSAAAKYEIPLLKSKCLSKLKSKISVDNAVRALVLADEAQDKALRSTAVSLISKNKDVMASKAWLSLVQENKVLADQVLNRVSGNAHKSYSEFLIGM